MNDNSTKLQNWVIHKIKAEYADDIDLLLAVEGHSVNNDDHGKVFDFFIPASERGYELAETFIIDGIGHDLYPRSWERMQRTADLLDDQTYCLGNSKILYAKNEAAVERFQQLCTRLTENLSNFPLVQKRAMEKIDVAMNIYKTLMFEEKLHRIRLGAGLIMHHLNNAVCYLNGTYLPQTDHLEKLKQVQQLPEHFLAYEEAIMCTDSMEELKNLSYLLIKTTRKFLAAYKSNTEPDMACTDFNPLADWYQELSLCWQRIYYYCRTDDYHNAFRDALYLQSELNIVSTEFQLKEMDLLGAYDYNNLAKLSARAKEHEQYITELLLQKNIPLNQFVNIQEFMEAH